MQVEITFKFPSIRHQWIPNLCKQDCGKNKDVCFTRKNKTKPTNNSRMSNNWDDVPWSDLKPGKYFQQLHPALCKICRFWGNFCLHKHTIGGIAQCIAFDCTSTPLQVPYSGICNWKLFYSETCHFVFSQQSKKHSVIVPKTKTLSFAFWYKHQWFVSTAQSTGRSEITSLTICQLNPNFPTIRKQGLKNNGRYKHPWRCHQLCYV